MKVLNRKRLVILLALCILGPSAAHARMDLVTLPSRDRVQITIYNSADLTLARDIRALTMKKGRNRLQFSWSGTLIDPTSLEMLPLSQAREIDVMSLEYPPKVSGLGIWNVDSGASGEVPFEITYFTSGISWKAYYLATLTPSENAVSLSGFVRVDNNSGEDYENAETRLVVGKINLLDRIAELARRKEPYGRPGPIGVGDVYGFPGAALEALPAEEMRAAKAMLAPSVRPKEIRKEGLSEYFLYTIEGTEDIENGWGKRLISFSADEIPVKNLYRYEEEEYGNRPVRFLSFVNDEDHGLGAEPIPGGLVKVFRNVDNGARLSYVGSRETRYIPKGGEVDLNMGPSELVSVTPVQMEYSTDNYVWREDRITGWDEHRTVQIDAANHQDIPVRIEVRRNFPSSSWELENTGQYGDHEKVDSDTVQYTMELPPHGKRSFTYSLTLHHGSRADR
ncbi:MAG: DUF4139 domain-containing protein [bacterium]|nr:MAG: DUF4139 domain-containing protein [bacterium]